MIAPKTPNPIQPKNQTMTYNQIILDLLERVGGAVGAVVVRSEHLQLIIPLLEAVDDLVEPYMGDDVGRHQVDVLNNAGETGFEDRYREDIDRPDGPDALADAECVDFH